MIRDTLENLLDKYFIEKTPHKHKGFYYCPYLTIMHDEGLDQDGYVCRHKNGFLHLGMYDKLPGYCRFLRANDREYILPVCYEKHCSDYSKLRRDFR